MTEPDSRRRQWPAGLLGALALIAAFEWFVVWHESDFTTAARIEWQLSRRAATREATKYPLLAFGTSMTKFGIYPAVVERRSGRPAFNLACVAGRMPGSYYLLKRALEAGARPEAVILEVHPPYMEMPFDDGLHAWPDLLEPADCLDLAWTARDASFLARTMLAKLLPSYHCRAEIRAETLTALQGIVSQCRHLNEIVVRNLAQNAGGYVSRRLNPYNGEIPPILADMYLKPTWKCNPLNERYLRKTLDLCVDHKIQVFWLIPPLVPALQARREQLGTDAAYTFWADGIRRQYPGMVMLDGRHSGFEFPSFRDAAHLEYAGASAFSAEVGRVVRATLERPSREIPRWFPLGPCRDPAIDVPLEEILQSASVVDAKETVRR